MNTSLQPGPCAVCGMRDYTLSFGGPTICPACDCGDSGPSRMNAQRERIAELERELAEEREQINVLKGALIDLTVKYDEAVAGISEGAKWIPVSERLPEHAGRYLAGRAHDNPGMRAVGEARYQPRLREWKFPSAAMGFTPTHWMLLPEAPK